MDENAIILDFAKTSLTKEVAKAFTISLAASAGTLAGFAVAGLAYDWYTKRKDEKKTPDLKTAE